MITTMFQQKGFVDGVFFGLWCSATATLIVSIVQDRPRRTRR